MDAREAALTVLAEEGGAELHWTVIWDRALRAGYVDPFTDAGARERMLRALSEEARAGRIEKTSTGTYRAKAS